MSADEAGTCRSPGTIDSQTRDMLAASAKNSSSAQVPGCDGREREAERLREARAAS